MVMLVSIQQASDHVRRDSTDDDAIFGIYVEAGSQAILNYIDDHSFLDSSGEVEVDSEDEPVGVPRPIQAAVLVVIGMLYADRDAPDFRSGDIGNPIARVENIILPRTLHFLLDPYRTPRLA